MIPTKERVKGGLVYTKQKTEELRNQKKGSRLYTRQKELVFCPTPKINGTVGRLFHVRSRK
jgi:hypothetical protein